MARVKVGEVRDLWRYPVKGMAGERVATVELGPQGTLGDRRWAVRDTARAEIQSCKFRPDLLRCAARLDPDAPGGVAITLPDGRSVGVADPEAAAAVSRLVGHASTLEPLRPADDAVFYRRHGVGDGTWLAELKATFEREPGEPLPAILDAFPPEAAEFVVRPGTFHLVTQLHLLTTATLAHLAALDPVSDWDVRRFRPNVLVDTGRDARGLLEQAWVGRRVLIGDAAVACVDTTPRCGAITRAQAEGVVADTGVLRTVVSRAAQNVGVYGEVAFGNEVRVGDGVFLDG
ncbi:MOSC domain-containing protein [Piscinibacter gummiphilus]|uniref:Uncharacterized protein n=1 Tax=Piscinibacter gummiphilus TaxID=946333 RepID=A0A1W6L4U6_9BURK|nr:MOSC N-terminal beta barrel domain-containing protein [Piscinibacter gummiphilus]ARN19351.1 hypothetical protein A4W93_05180 [Piscinibacter gummiphilus]ATU64018.1 MOSC domain-containing protein [Piscinibacter gummiphilus]GLS93021.1 molybdenum cofactor sulfurase [Piscinibacter gummiphilus]